MATKTDLAKPKFTTEVEAKDVMRRTGWLSQTPESFQANFLERCRVLKVEAGQRVYGLDDPPGGIYGLASGSVAVSMAPQERGPYFAHLMGIGSWFGLAAAMQGHSRLVGMSVTRASTVLLLPVVEFNALVNENPGAWRFFTVMALMNAAIAMNAADDLLIRDTSRRCIATLLRLAGLRNGTGAPHAFREVDVTQEELAFLSNLSRNATGLLLRDMEGRGHLELAYKSIRILNATALLEFVRSSDDD